MESSTTETPRPALSDVELAAAPHPTEAVDDLDTAGKRLRDRGRAALGFTGGGGDAPLRETLSASGVTIYPVVALGLLVSVDQLQSTGFTVLAPEITSTLGVSRTTYTFIILLKTLAVSLATLPLAAFVQRQPRRALVTIVTAYAWVLLTALTAFHVGLWELLAVAVLVGVATASVRSIHQPLLLDSYPPAARVRVMSLHRGFDSLGDVMGPVLIGVCTLLLDFTWRGVFLAMAVVSALFAVLASRLKDPGFGRWDTDQVRNVARADAHADDRLSEDDVSLGFFEITRRLYMIPTIRRVLAAYAVLGMFIAPFVTYLAFFLQERWGMDPGERAVFFAIMPLFGIAALRAFGRRGERMFSEDPSKLLRFASGLMASGMVCLGLAVFAPYFIVMAVLFAASMAVLTVITPALAMPMFSIIPAHMRPHMGALSGIFLVGVGGTAGLFLLSGIDNTFGTSGAILSLAVPGVIAAAVLRTAQHTVNDDLDRMVGEVIEEEELRVLATSGTKLPMLACRHIDFSYGTVQVLFDVDFTVDDGEMVALLGTNGAGKSTLLNVVSGVGLPTRGSVRFRGADVTFLDPTRRVGLGIRQIPGGRGVFGPMTVIENLRVMGYVNRRSPKLIEQGIEASFDAFPRLAERRNELAATLSGGEQQMLTLASAYLVKPQLLLIDELSLGLAPIVVDELVDMVKEINRRGTAVVLIEQSVSVALSVVEHAYFMEKGQIRFDGSTRELRDRPDLLRSVFFGGGVAPVTTK